MPAALMTGVELIAAERERQVSAEGWTAEHDDKHPNGQLACAAVVYAMPADFRFMTSVGRSPFAMFWPFAAEWWKPSPDNRIRELAKAGALIAAEIDRLQRSNPAPRQA